MIGVVMMDELLRELQPFFLVVQEHVSAVSLVAAGLGALAGLFRARLLVAACLALGGLGVWMLANGIVLSEVPTEFLIGAAVLTVVGVFEAVLIIIGGRDSAPMFWGTLFAGLLGLVLLASTKSIGALVRSIRR